MTDLSNDAAEPERDVERQLDWELRNRTKAAVAAAVGGVLMIAPTIYIGVTHTNSDAPTVGPIQALTPALNGEVTAQTSPREPIIEYWAHNSTASIISGVMLAVGMLGIGYLLWYLFMATRARRPELPAFARWLAVIGPLLVAVSSIGVPLFRYLGCQAFLDGSDHSRDAVDQALGGTGVLVSAIIGLAGQLSLALSFVLISLNAMRVGLLTQFMGIMGVIAGALFVFQFGPAPIIQAFWLIALVPLFLHRWPGKDGQPRAWLTGVAVPWPTAAERRGMNPAAAAASTGASSDLSDDAADPRPAPNRPQHTSRKRRKR